MGCVQLMIMQYLALFTPDHDMAWPRRPPDTGLFDLYYQKKNIFAWGLMTFLKRTGKGPVFELYDNFHRSYDHEDDV